ncbi:hypothetical protein PIB30_042964 [Stylosanthes scabra]|uniref:Bet v I/Major latex protein domain-containing protein n=1 Tax=Stylosanthes scabra TaxID=79078 RepID=A0ABU6QFX9_9FABA|nr:hypothetical protein [Stylosanthes scabra]
MASVAGKLEVEIEVKSNVEKFWGIVKDFPTISKVIPDYKIMEITEGDGKVPGSIIKATVDLVTQEPSRQELHWCRSVRLRIVGAASSCAVITTPRRLVQSTDRCRLVLSSRRRPSSSLLLIADRSPFCYTSSFSRRLPVTADNVVGVWRKHVLISGFKALLSWQVFLFSNSSYLRIYPQSDPQPADNIRTRIGSDTKGKIADIVSDPIRSKLCGSDRENGHIRSDPCTALASLDMHSSEKAVFKERIEGVDDAKRTLTYSVIDGDLLKYLKSYKGCVSVTPKVDNNGSIVKWSCDYEKASQDVPEPIFLKDFATKMFSKFDDYLLSA